MLDNKKLAVIHIVKKELGLTDQEYRDILEKVTGTHSSKYIDEQGFRKLMNYFARSRHYRINREAITFRQKLYIKHLQDDLGWDDSHLNNFIKKYYQKTNVDTLTKKEAGKAIESLKKIITRKLSST